LARVQEDGFHFEAFRSEDHENFKYRVRCVMVGLGLDTGQITYVRNQGQAAVDAAALAAVSGLPSRTPAEVQARAAAYNSKNSYVESPTNQIDAATVS